MADFNVDRLNIEIAANATKASQALDKLITRVDKLTSSLKKLSPVASKVNKSLSGIAKTTKAIDVKAFNSLSSSIKDITKQNTNLNKVNTTMKKLASTTAKVKSSVSGTSTGVSGSTRSGGGVLGMFGMVGKLGLIYYGLRRVGEGFAYAIGKANDLVETTNLFNVAMGDSVDHAREFVDTFAQTTGLNPVEIMEGTALFYQISTAMGLATDKAQVLSENFTKLAFDLASLYNIETDEAFTKLKAGLVGETEPLRRLGLVITENNLAETARRLGITKSIRTMTEAEKMQLRYITLLDQSTNAQGDFARTIEQPANMLRVLKGGVEQLAVAFGNMFIPVLTKVLPYLIAFVDVLTDAIQAVAAFFGYEPEEFKVLNNDISQIGDTAEETAASVNSMLAPFDKLNVLNASSGSSASGGDMLDLNLEAYENFVSSLKPKWLGIAEDIKDSFSGMFDGVDFTSLKTSWDNLRTSLGNIYTDFTKPGWKWFVDNIVKPLTEWTIEIGIPTAFNTMAEALETIANLSELLQPVLVLIDRIMNGQEKIADNSEQKGIFGDGNGFLGAKNLLDVLTEFNDLWDKTFGTYAWDERRAILDSSLSMYMNRIKWHIGTGLDTTKTALLDFKDVTLPNVVNGIAGVLEHMINTILGAVESLINGVINKVNSLSEFTGITLGTVNFGDISLPEMDYGDGYATRTIESGLQELMRYDPSATGNGTTEVTVVIDSKEIAKATSSGTTTLDRQNGKTRLGGPQMAP